jgi:biopolymer transport protein ExbD
MAEIIQEEGHKKSGKKRPKKHGTHIDMTPMVDLACLLLTFFMLTTAFSKPKVMEIVIPEKDKDTKNQPKINDSRVINIIVAKDDRVFWYNGMIDPKKPIPEFVESNFSKDGIRKMLLNRNKSLFRQIEQLKMDVTTGKKVMPQDSVSAEIRKLKRIDKDEKIGPIVLIKAMEGAKYGNIVDAIDEMEITNIAVYTIVDINDQEKKFITEKLSIPKNNK